MSAPVFNTTANCLRTYINWSNTNSYTNSAQIWKTSGANQFALCVVGLDKATGPSNLTAISVTDGSTTLNFALIGRIEGPSQAPQYGFVTIELWGIAVASQFNAANAAVTLSITSSANIDNAVISLCSITGLASIATPYDPNILSPISSVVASPTQPPILTFTTVKPDDLLFFISTGIQTTDSVAPSGYTQQVNTFNGGGGAFASQMIATKQVSATQTSQTVQDAAGTNKNWAAMFVAFTANPSVKAYQQIC